MDFLQFHVYMFWRFDGFRYNHREIDILKICLKCVYTSTKYLLLPESMSFVLIDSLNTPITLGVQYEGVEVSWSAQINLGKTQVRLFIYLL